MNKKSNHSAEEKAKRLEDYVGGKLSASEQHAFEKESMRDDFEEEALDGWVESGLASNASAIVAELQGKLDQQSGVSKPSFWLSATVQKVAAAAILVGGIGGVWWSAENRSSGEELAFQQETPLQKKAAESSPTGTAQKPEPQARNLPEIAETKETELLEEDATSVTSENTPAALPQKEENLVITGRNPTLKKVAPSAQNAEPIEQTGEAVDAVVSQGSRSAQLVILGLDSASYAEEEKMAGISEEQYADITEATDTIQFMTERAEQTGRSELADVVVTAQGTEIRSNEPEAMKKARTSLERERENTNYGSSDALSPKGGWNKFQQYIDDNRKTFPENLEKLLPVGITLNFRTEKGRPVWIESDSWGNPVFLKEAKRLLQEGPDWEPTDTIDQAMILIELRPRQKK